MGLLKMHLVALCLYVPWIAGAQDPCHFKVVAFYTAKNDPAHISFVAEANEWFKAMAATHDFCYSPTDNWAQLEASFLSLYDVVIFLDTRPEMPEQRRAFEKYMRDGGSWMGFHFAAFAQKPSDFPENWDWYHRVFLGSGSFKGNTWRPTSAILKVEDKKHPVTDGIPGRIHSAPSEWYSWENDLRGNPDIDILLSIDPRSFPLGTGPKPNEIWHRGYYPVVWTNTRYHMVYFNMGHNDMDYENKTNKTLSGTFDSRYQNKLILNALLWLGGVERPGEPAGNRKPK